MIEKTEGIVLNYTKFKETSIIVKILTRDFGLASFLVNNIRSKKSKRSMGMFQPFNLVELSFYHKQNTGDLFRLNEIKLNPPLHSIQTEIRKTTLALFLSEVLGKLFFHEKEEMGSSFTFLKDSVIYLENIKSGVENFHIQFLLKIAIYLGFGIEDTSQFLIKNSSDNQKLMLLLEQPYGYELPISGSNRYEILESVLTYYRQNVNGFSNIKSLEVLRAIFH